ncbi:MAG: RNase P subunit p30 family protein [Candidatus Bathyarchaeia archaeon]|jgi:ribonuclease P/MRP protein subunit RPP1
MKRTYTDLHLRVNISDPSQASRLISKASTLGYSLVAVPLSPWTPEHQLEQVQRVCEEVSIGFASRVDLKPRTPEELLKDVRKLRRRFELVAVMCESKAVARQAAKDRRVDLLNFPQPDFRRAFFDSAEAELASSCLASLEVDMKPLLTQEGAAKVKLLSLLRKEVQTAKEFHVPIVLSSGVSEELLMRRPLDLAALSFLFGLDKDIATEAVSKNPTAIVRRNREKLSPRFIAPGIRVTRRGNDC